jgi:galactitol-specific phosphotransferase system IIB component
LEWQEMRIDLVLISMYGEIPNAMDAVDIILAINGIDNPLNIKAGMILIYPNNIDNIDDFRCYIFTIIFFYKK